MQFWLCLAIYKYTQKGISVYFHFETLRTYTASLLSLFGDLEVQTTHSNGKIHTSRVPIQYSNREKSDIINQLDYNQIFSANSQILPRAVLIFTSMAPARERAKVKFQKIFAIDTPSGKRQFQFNSIPYNFEFQIVAQTRGMNEACQIIEQVCTYFNPSYNMKIAEVPIAGVEKTSVKLELTNTTVEQQDIDDYSTNITTITFDLTLSGNLYPAIKESAIVKEIQMFLHNDNGRVSGIQTGEIQTIINQYKCDITGIAAVDNTLEAQIVTKCEKLIKYKFEWFINGIQLPQSTQKITHTIKPNDAVKVRAYTDLVSSEFFEIELSEVDIKYNISVTDIIYDGGYLSPVIEDFKPQDTHYSYEWYINGIRQDTDKNTLKYEINTSTNEKQPLNRIDLRVCGDDGRKSLLFEKYFN